MASNRKVAFLFGAALDIDSDGERANYLDEACSGDEDLRKEVEMLLQAHAEAGGFMKDLEPSQGGEHVQILRHAFPELQTKHSLEGTSDGDNPLRSSDRVEPENGVLGDFRILREIGRGGMGVVYEAQQISLDRKIALKILPFAAVLDSRQLKRFQNEAMAAATLEHPHIVPVYSVGTDRGVYYYAMRLIQGCTLADVIADVRTRSKENVRRPGEPAALGDSSGTAVGESSEAKRLPFPDGLPEHADTLCEADGNLLTVALEDSTGRFRAAACFGVQIAEALHYAHEQGIIHRDVKPSNLLIDAERHLWVTDFGLARVEGSKELTGTGELIGTLRYMSPEQVLANRGVVDHRSDVYSLGATLYELLALRPMHNAEGHSALIREIADEEPPPPRKIDPRIPRDLETIILKATSKDAKDRYSSAKEMGEDLQRFLDDRPILAQPPSLGSRLSKWTWRNRRPVTTAVAFLIAALVLAIGQLWYVAATETQLRREAEANRYLAEMPIACEAWKEGNTSMVLRLLDNHIPRAGEPDLRCWEWYYLKSLCHKDLATLAGHKKSVNWIAWSPNGKRLATASSDTTVRVWDTTERKILFTLSTGEHPVRWVAWSPDGNHIYSLSDSEPVRIWDADTRQPLGFLGERVPSRAVLSHDGRRILTVDLRGWVAVYGASDGKELNRWWGKICWGPIALSDDYLVSTETWPGRVRIFDANTGEQLTDKTPPLHATNCVLFSPDGSRFVTASDNGAMKLWNPTDGAELLHVQAHEGGIAQVAWRADGCRLTTVGDDGKIKLWDTSTGQEINTLRGHAARVRSVAWSPDGSLLATGDAKGDVKLWDPGAIQTCLLVNGRRTAAWSPDGKWFITGGQELGSIDVRSPDKDGKIDVYNAWSWKPAIPPIREKYFGATQSIEWSPDGTRLAISGREGRLKVFEMPTKREILSLLAHEKTVNALAWHPNGEWLATAGADNRVKVWDVSSSKLLVCLGPQAYSVGAVAWSPNGRSIVSFNRGGEISIWNVATWRKSRTLRSATPGSNGRGGCGTAWSPSGDRLAAATLEGSIIVWDVKSGREVLSRHDAHVAPIRCLAWSPDGERIATGGEDRTVKVWSVNNGTRMLTLRGHEYPVMCLKWSPDGRQLASAARDGIRIWGSSREEVHP